MDYIFRYLTKDSKFFNDLMDNGKILFFNAHILKNYRQTAYNLILKKRFLYFIDPVTYLFQYGGNSPFFVKYLENFEDIGELFDEDNKIDYNILQQDEFLVDFYNIIIQFQKRTLARTTIPLDYYISIAKGEPVVSFNPNANLLFTISPYFEFNSINDRYYDLTKSFSEIDKKNYVILRFPKEILENDTNIDLLFSDFSKNIGIILNPISLDEYNKVDIKKYFPNLIELIYKYSKNDQEVITLNNSEFCKYFKIFGLDFVCSNVMIGQKTNNHQPNNTNTGGNTDLVFIPQLERSISLSEANTLQSRNSEINEVFPTPFSELDMVQKNEIYLEHINERTSTINNANNDEILNQMEDSFDKIDVAIHRDKFNYYLAWMELIRKKMQKYSL